MTKFSYELLHPKAVNGFRLLSARLKDGYEAGYTSTLFLPFEGYRSAERQLQLFRQVPRVTKAKPWQSAHQYGLAVDYVPFETGSWTWNEDADWRFLKETALNCGMVHEIAWDRPHVTSPIWIAIRGHLL